MPSPIIARADALMQRRRQTLAGADEVPVLVDALDDDDIPILLQVDAPAEPAPLPPAFAATPAAAPSAAEQALPAFESAPEPDTDAAEQEYIVRELTRRIEARLSAELPGIIAATIRDFLAEHNPTEDLHSHP